MEHRPATLPSFWTLQFGGWGLYAALLIITFMPIVAAEGGELRLMMAKGVRAGFGLGLTSLLRLGYRRAFPGSIKRQAAWSLVGGTVLGIAWALLGEAWAAWLYAGTYQWAPKLVPRFALEYAITLTGWSALYFGIKHARAWQEERERALRADALAQEARLASLRHQMHPHFLFNALSSLRALIGEDPTRARRMVTEMADFLRFSLQKADAPHVPLEEELAMARSYLSIESVRFEEKLDASLDVAPGLEHLRVPAFLIQPLVDNAVKHGMASGVLPVRVRVRVHREHGALRVLVSNTGHWAPTFREPDPRGTGTGLRNVRERLTQLFGERARLTTSETEGWVHVLVELPAGSPSPVEECHDDAPARPARG
ncbi:histidine kinase [Myxococcus stipitatus]|uniref:sensor histidine kinase n=1 Tax=Myxococcus stipitatus TaxID=83455 RepID=UPI001F22BD2F|nr:histidine kinase [Myxococcus stipitatus]MCE9669802.1 histidine kinase [Myxococcus stipitatus]